MNQKVKNAPRYLITIPQHRLDLAKPEDLVEEIAKFYGYDNIASSLPVLPQKKIVINQNQLYRDLIRQVLSSLGYQEIITYSLVAEEIKDDFCYPGCGEFYQSLVPKNENHVYYRQSILPSHLKVINYNLTHQNENLFFFEISKIYFLNSADSEEEILTLSGTGKIITNSVHKLEQAYDFFWLKGAIENIFQSLNIMDKINFTPSSIKELHPYQGADILLKPEKVGFLGQIHPYTSKKYQLNHLVWGAQISLSKLFSFLQEKVSQSGYQIVSSFPKIEQDLSFYLPEIISASQVIEIIKKNGGS